MVMLHLLFDALNTETSNEKYANDKIKAGFRLNVVIHFLKLKLVFLRLSSFCTYAFKLIKLLAYTKSNTRLFRIGFNETSKIQNR